MKRLSNIGFGIAAIYCLYLVGILVTASLKNQSFEGQALGPAVIEKLVSGASGNLVKSVEKIDVAEAAGGEKQILVLWATWCGACHSLLSDLKDEVQAGRLDAQRILAVSMVEPLTDVEAYLQKTPLPFRVALDREGVLARRLNVSGTPTVVFLDSTSIIRQVTTGGFGMSRKISDFLR